MSTKQDRHGVRTAADLEQKYNLGELEKLSGVVRVDAYGRKSVEPDSIEPTGLGNCKWEYIESIGKTVLVRN